MAVLDGNYRWTRRCDNGGKYQKYDGGKAGKYTVVDTMVVGQVLGVTALAALGIALVTSAVIAACMLLFGHQILECFISGEPEEAKMTMDIAYHYLAVMSVFLPILYILHVVRSALQGMGDTVLPMVSGVAEFVMRTGTAILLPPLIGEEGIFYAEILAWAGADVILAVSYFKKVH